MGRRTGGKTADIDAGDRSHYKLTVRTNTFHLGPSPTSAEAESGTRIIRTSCLMFIDQSVTSSDFTDNSCRPNLSY